MPWKTSFSRVGGNNRKFNHIVHIVIARCRQAMFYSELQIHICGQSDLPPYLLDAFHAVTLVIQIALIKSPKVQTPTSKKPDYP